MVKAKGRCLVKSQDHKHLTTMQLLPLSMARVCATSTLEAQLVVALPQEPASANHRQPLSDMTTRATDVRLTSQVTSHPSEAANSLSKHNSHDPKYHLAMTRRMRCPCP